MKSFLPVLSAVVIFASCTTAYHNGQTPDDVYFSPQRPQAEYVKAEDKKDKYRYEENDDDRYLRMKVRNRRMWDELNYYYSDPYAYNYYYRTYNNVYLNNPWNSYSYWNYYYNPYGPQVIVTNPKAPVYNKPRQYNLNVYTPPANNTNSNSKRRVFGNSEYNDQRYEQPTYSAPRNSSGSNLRNVFGSSSGSSSSSSSSSSSESRSSSSSSGSSSSGSSSGKSVRKF